MDKLWNNIERSAAGCWLWMGAVFEKRGGYGAIKVGGRAGRVHRTHVLAWELTAGRSLPEGMVVLHSCDEPRCINPEHLSLGTHADNIADKVSKGRHARGEKHSAAMIRAWKTRRAKRACAQPVDGSREPHGAGVGTR